MKSPIGLALCLAMFAMPFPVAAQDSSPALSLHEAIKMALEKSPSFGAAIDRSEAMMAATSKAGALPNPELSIEAENIGGDGPYEGFDGAMAYHNWLNCLESALADRMSQKVKSARAFMNVMQRAWI